MSTYDTNKKLRAKVDTRLKNIAFIQAHLGIDSTNSEIERAKKEQRALWYEIKDLDKEFFNCTYLLDKD